MNPLRGKLPRAILLVVLLGMSWIVYFVITRPNASAPVADDSDREKTPNAVIAARPFRTGVTPFSGWATLI